MPILHAIVLAIVQGATEFIPVSSSAHLILIPYFLGWPDQGLAFDVAGHVGTMLAALLYFRRDLTELVSGFFSGRRPLGADFDPRRLGWAILAATIPTGLIGLAFHHWAETEARNPLLIAGTSIGFGILLFLADRVGRKWREIGDFGIIAGFVVGCAQGLALVPGTSRSGITITAALLLGFLRPAAARFSFLLVIPVSALAALLEGWKLMKEGVAPGMLLPMGIGLVVSAVVGFVAIDWLLAWLRRRSLTPFVVYRVLLGLLILGVVYWRAS
ncbi:MAG TPA: undecaprenyl-diphosphate phosphatase [Thermoanaerobaculia bacterium]|nr:undecaprenyl-diphosphate phosphatase [Thermoanaerobaculia bacterium]